MAVVGRAGGSSWMWELGWGKWGGALWNFPQSCWSGQAVLRPHDNLSSCLGARAAGRTALL